MALRSCSRHSSPPASPSPPPSPPPPPPCLACPSTEALPLVLPLTDQTSCPSRLKFRQQLLTRLGLPSTVAYLPLTELPPRALRCLCAQLIDSFRICYMSDQDLYFADAVALELHKEARRRRRERRDGKKGASTQAKDVSEICAEHDGVTEHTGTDSEDSRMPPEVRGAAGVLPIVMAPDVLEEWGLLSGCESPSNLRRALFEIQNRLRYLSLREGETNAAIPPMAEYAAVSLGPSASSSSASPASSPPDRAVTLRQYISHMQHLIDRFCAPANAPVGADAEVDVSFTKKYHEEAKKLGVHIHPSIQIVKIPGAGRGLMASESIPAGTPVVDVPEKAMLNVYADMLPPPRDETQQPLLVGPPELPEFLGDTPLMRTIDESQLKAFSLFRRLLPVLRDTFGSYEKFVALCFCEKARDSHMEGNAGDDTDEEKLRAHWAEISAFLQSLDLQKFIWAQSLMGSRAFSVKVPPPVVLPGWQVEERSEETNAENHEEVQRPAGGEDVHESNSDEHFAANEGTKEYSWHGGLTAAKEKRATVSGNESGSESSKTEGAALVGGAENGDNAAAPEGSMKRAKVCGDLEMLHPQTSSGGRTGRARSGGPGAVEGREQSRGAVEEDAASDSDSVPFLPELRERRNDPPVYRARFCSSSSGGMPRCSPGSAGGDAQEGDPAPVICVPDHPTTFLLFADMMNHHVHSQCAFPFFDSATRSARMVVQAHVPPGAQLFMFYGPMQSWELFAHYGFSTSSFFALENNHAHTKDNSADQDAAVTRERPPAAGTGTSRSRGTVQSRCSRLSSSGAPS
ncbi:hypothetical protein BESB_059360 [Besnoitia besnoiti]|uniref:SET domain-containing protein n=1 Tax=Besnoitia besnoiti TaxID=94643 RepID=A0A2A9MAZ0_BESBE|nr:hypothetical protein BESB_059360 [Besnoitia besnoiti]PFH35049.1 hypothetical protein BESB_059360 [Besnoitia besnoiti]